MPQIYGFSPKVNTRSLLFQHINQNIQYKEQIKMKQIISNGRKSSLNQSQRERTREKNWLRTPEVTPSSSQCRLPPHYPSPTPLQQPSPARPGWVSPCKVSPYLCVFGNGWWENLRQQRLFHRCHTRKASPRCGDARGRWACWPEQSAARSDRTRRASHHCASWEQTDVSGLLAQREVTLTVKWFSSSFFCFLLTVVFCELKHLINWELILSPQLLTEGDSLGMSALVIPSSFLLPPYFIES